MGLIAIDQVWPLGFCFWVQRFWPSDFFGVFFSLSPCLLTYTLCRYIHTYHLFLCLLTYLAFLYQLHTHLSSSFLLFTYALSFYLALFCTFCTSVWENRICANHFCLLVSGLDWAKPLAQQAQMSIVNIHYTFKKRHKTDSKLDH